MPPPYLTDRNLKSWVGPAPMHGDGFKYPSRLLESNGKKQDIISTTHAIGAGLNPLTICSYLSNTAFSTVSSPSAVNFTKYTPAATLRP